MLAKFIRDDIEYRGPDNLHVDDTHIVEIRRNRRPSKVRMWKKGARVRHPEAFRLVQMGFAEPADEECKLRADMSPELMDEAAHAYERLQLGIVPDDFERYDRGEMAGYNADGSDIPGPNAATFDDVEEDDENEED